MGKQNIFWAVLSASILIVIILVVGVLVLKQKPSARAEQTVSPLADTGTSLYEYSPQQQQTPPQQQQQQQQATPTQPEPGATPQSNSGQPEEMKIIVGEQPPQIKPSTETAAPAAAPQAPPAAAKPVAPTPVPQRTAAVPAKPQPQQKKPAAQAPSAQTSAKVVEYWIQTGSYKSQTKAEDLAAQLSDKGLVSRVFSFMTGDQTTYRVRVGPYTNKQEAERFLSMVKQIQGLESSYVSEVQGTRALN